MKLPFTPPPTGFDAEAISDTIERALKAAGLDTRTGPVRDATETIRRALSGTGGAGHERREASAEAPIDVSARWVDQAFEAPDEAAPPIPDDIDQGRFDWHRHQGPSGSRRYRLYVPAGLSDAAPLVVMLHGCTQSPDDFALGTQMNRLADVHGVVVAYPEQPAHANSSNCWNWFLSKDQQRDGGEPSIIAGIAREVTARHCIDADRVFVAGLSAGAAMALVMGETHPDVFAAVGVHSGLPFASAHDVPSALKAMKGGRGRGPFPAASGTTRTSIQPVPVIVFHGDRDHTVQATNAAEILRQAVQAHAPRGLSVDVVTSTAGSAAERGHTRTLHRDAQGRIWVESWTVHGAGHAWSGGDARGSFTDPRGPDASGEMLRFFLSHSSKRAD